MDRVRVKYKKISGEVYNCEKVTRSSGCLVIQQTADIVTHISMKSIISYTIEHNIKHEDTSKRDGGD
jgi:hypothetical protein